MKNDSRVDLLIVTNVDAMLEFHTCTMISVCLELLGLNVVVANMQSKDFSEKYKNLNAANNIILYRMSDIPREIIILKNRGKKIGYIIDDNIFYEDKDQLIGREYKEKISKVIKFCDFAIGNNDRLVSEIKKINKNSFCLDKTPVWDGFYDKMSFSKVSKNDDTDIRIGIIGGLGNSQNCHKYLLNLIKIVEGIENITIVYFSNNKYNYNGQTKLEHHQYINSGPVDWYNKLHSLKLDAVFAEYEDNMITKSKSNLKFRESAMMRIPLFSIDHSKCIYANDIELGVNGFWCDSFDEMKDQMPKFLNKEKLSSMGEKAYQKLSENDPVVYANRILDILKINS
jgi:uncharacterized phage-like protein YoqJ